VEELPTVTRARQALERFEESVKRTLREMPAARRAALGYRLSDQKATVFPPDAVRAIHEEVGDETFYEMVSMSKAKIEKALPGEPDRVARILQMGDLVRGTTSVARARGS
jgi:hypothetical protein